MANALELYNAALTQVSSEPMLDENEDTPHGIAARELFRARYDQLLALAQWKFAIKRVRLAAVTSSSPNYDAADELLYVNKRYRYELPEDHIRPIGLVVRHDAANAPGKWEQEGSWLLTNDASPIILKYMARVDVEKIVGPFLVTIETLLAMDLASKLARDEAMARRLSVEFKSHLNIALQTVTPFVDYPGLGFDVPTGVANAASGVAR